MKVVFHPIRKVTFFEMSLFSASQEITKAMVISYGHKATVFWKGNKSRDVPVTSSRDLGDWRSCLGGLKTTQEICKDQRGHQGKTSKEIRMTIEDLSLALEE